MPFHHESEEKEMNSQVWYREFWKRSLNDRRINQNCSTREYTKRMDAFLRNMAQNLRFDVVEPESRVFGNGRIDQLWKRDDFEITIEHENDYFGVDNETRKLCKNKSDLKVLITYVEDEDLYSRAQDIAKQVENQVRQGDDFLLIVGDYAEYGWCADWVAFRPITTVRMELVRGRPLRQGKLK